MKKILVTGGAGFIGSNLCQKLLNQGNFVIAVDNLITSKNNNLKQLLGYPRFKFFKHDITKSFINGEQRIKTGKIDYIYHLACPTGVPNLTTLAEEMLMTCSFGTRNILELARYYDIKILFTSSSEIYGNPEIFPQSEEYTGNVDPVGIRSPYEEGKRFSESLVAMYARKYGVNVRIVRIFNTYGPNMSMNDSRVIPNFINQLDSGKPLSVQGDGSQKRTFCDVDDLTAGLMLVMKSGISGDVYNLGGDREVSILELAKLILKISGATNKIEFVERPKHDHKSRRPDLSKVKALGWKRIISLEQGLKRTMEWYGIGAGRKLFV